MTVYMRAIEVKTEIGMNKRDDYKTFNMLNSKTLKIKNKFKNSK